MRTIDIPVSEREMNLLNRHQKHFSVQLRFTESGHPYIYCDTCRMTVLDFEESDLLTRSDKIEEHYCDHCGNEITYKTDLKNAGECEKCKEENERLKEMENKRRIMHGEGA